MPISYIQDVYFNDAPGATAAQAASTQAAQTAAAQARQAAQMQATTLATTAVAAKQKRRLLIGGGIAAVIFGAGMFLLLRGRQSNLGSGLGHVKKADEEALEAIVDRSEMTDVLESLASIAQEKAEHIATNWQDKDLARTWDRMGRRLNQCRASLTK